MRCDVRYSLAEARWRYELELLLEGPRVAGLTQDPELAGTITVSFTIAGTGYVAKAEAVDPYDFADPQVPRCVAEVARNWRSPKPSGGTEVVVTFPFEPDPG